jgi:uncharacterized membrane protein
MFKHQIMKKSLFILTVISLVVIISCKKNTTTTPSTTIDCNGSTAKFSTDAAPVIATKCATNSNCHANGATNSGGVLTSHTLIFSRKSNIRTAVSNGSMPQGGTLTQAEKQAIVCWIDNGALNN